MSALGLGRAKTAAPSKLQRKYSFESPLWEREEQTELRRGRIREADSLSFARFHVFTQPGSIASIGDVRVTSAFPPIADLRQMDRQVRKVLKTDSCAAASRPLRSPGQLAAIWRWASFECRGPGFRGTTRCRRDNSPRPSAGEKLSLLTGKGSKG